jgi:hypothetical protein
MTNEIKITLKGKQGEKGEQGIQGEVGQKGDKGNGVSTTKNILYFSSIVLISMSIVILFYIGYLLAFDGNNALVYPKEPMKVTTDGKTQVTVQVQYCRNSDKLFESHASFNDGLVYSIPSQTIAGAPKGCGTVNRIWDIPEGLPNGNYYLSIKNTVEVNKLKTFTASYTTERFNVSR